MKRLTNKEFVQKLISIHGNKYDYKLIEYVNSRTKVIIICHKHGQFEKVAGQLIHDKQGCSECAKEKISTEEIIERSIKIHGNKYDYSLVNYKNLKTKVKIICPTHGIFEQTPEIHVIKKSGCPKCYGNKKLTTEEFIKQANEVHSEKYDYSLANYINKRTKLKIICPIHGVFEQKPEDHIRNKSECPICNLSKGEKKIIKFLNENKISFVRQKTFKGCKYRYELPFDFYLPSFNTCIEYDGIQHFVPIDFFGGEVRLKEQILKDSIKTNYCKKENIKLIRIKYSENVFDKLKKEIIY